MYKANVEALQVNAMHTGQPELVPQSTWESVTIIDVLFVSVLCPWI